MQFGIQLFGAALNLFSVALPQRSVQSPYVRADRIMSRWVENIALVTQIFLGVAQQEFAVFNVARREHELNVEARMSNVETMTRFQ
jgi:hypothetical protein